MSEPVPGSIPWYTSATDYEAILRLVPLAEANLARPYEHWIKVAERFEDYARSQGVRPVRIEVNPLAIKKWCEANNRPVCRESIAAYAAEILISGLRAIEGN